MTFKKIFSIFVVFFLIPIFWSGNFIIATLDTYFNPLFYDEEFTNVIYEESKAFIVSDIIKQNLDFLQDIPREELNIIVSKHYQSSDVAQIINQIIQGIVNYQAGAEILISLEEIKLAAKNIVEEILAYSNIVNAVYTLSQADFYEYIPAQINLTEKINQSVLEKLNMLFVNNNFFKFGLIFFMLCGFFVLYFFITDLKKKRIFYSGISLLVISTVNFIWMIIFFTFLKNVFIKNFPIERINNVKIDLNPEIYNVFINPLHDKMQLEILILFLIGLILMVVGIKIMKDNL